MDKILSADVIAGGKRHFIMLHGLYGNRNSWASVAKQLSPQFTVHLPDLRNHGDSFHDSANSYNDMADDIKFYVDKNHIDKFVLLGHSMGGKVAMFFAAKYPQYLDKLIVADISPCGYTSLTNDSPHARFHLNLMSLMQSLNLNDFATHDQIANFLRGNDAKTVSTILKNIKRTSGGLEWKINLTAIANALPEIMGGLDVDDFISRKIAVPTLFIKCGRSDFIQPNDLKVIRFIFADVRLVEMKNCSHWLHADDPVQTAKIISAFVEDQH